ncbi:MAG: FadR family transcriptional regulator [Acidobacteria bacterium]|nr:MAG: FadR family transcriptional regulator [Acidobacteriota bacterium]
MANTDSAILQDKFKPIDKTSLSEEIAAQIMSLVSSGDLMPGQKLPSERELCLRFEVGRSSLREALRCLTIVGVLETRVGEGTFLAMNRDKFIGKVLEWRVATERKNVENLMKVRLALETETAANAALNTHEQDVRKLEELLARMKASIGNPEQVAETDIAFHLGIAEASANQLIFDLLNLIRSQLEIGLMKVSSFPGASEIAYHEHVLILNAIRAHDAESAKALMRDHIGKALNRYVEANGMLASATK